MPFQNKNLLVTLLPKGINIEAIAKICLWRTNICRWPTFCFHRTCINWASLNCGPCSYLGTWGGGCGFNNSCGPGGSACDPTIFCAGGSDPFVIEDLEDLVTLRRELTETLQRLDEIQKEGLQSGITTRAEADAMEKQLTEQLEHIRRTKEGLR